jgi:hypothetical protein
MTKTQTMKTFNVVVIRNRSNTVTLTMDEVSFFSLGYSTLPSSFFYDGPPPVLAFQLGFQGFKGPNG